MSQGTLEELSGISRSQISRIEKGEISPTIQELSRFSQVFNVEVCDLINTEITEHEQRFILSLRRLISAYIRQNKTKKN